MNVVIDLNRDGEPRTAYVREKPGNLTLTYDKRTPSGWQSEKVLSVLGEGSVQLRVDDTDTPHIIYYDTARNVTVYAVRRPCGSGNRAPVADAGGPYVGAEGVPIALSGALSTDPDGNSLQFRWDFDGDGTWDTDWSPNPTASFTFPDDFSGASRLEVTDGVFNVTAESPVVIRNIAPTVDAGLNEIADEGSSSAFVFASTDPGFDAPGMSTWENVTATVDWGYGPPEPAMVVKMPGSPGVATRGYANATHTYGDNGAFTVTVTVCDDDGGCGSDTMVVTVRNVDPAFDDVQVYVLADLRLRVAGEKWHDLRMDLVWNGDVTATAGVTRYPGSPDDQSVAIEGARLQLLGDFRIVLTYRPEDDPPNGQPSGATPAWVIVTLPDGSQVRLHHTFNVRYSATWAWTVEDLRPNRIGQEITFTATASDTGSDDLTFAWDFGDGTSAMRTYYNDGVGPDPFPSPEVNPMVATDAQAHAYALPGTYAVLLTVTDDDGGDAEASIPIRIWGPKDLKLDAATMVEDALSYDPGDADLMDALGYLYMSLGDNANASRFGMGGSEVRWAPDGTHVDDHHGGYKGVDVFQYEEESVDKLIAYLENEENAGTGVADVILTVIERMRDADRTLTTIAIADAEAAGGDPDLIAVARGLLASADAYWDTGDLWLIADYVIDQLEESWEKAVQASGPP